MATEPQATASETPQPVIDEPGTPTDPDRAEDAPPAELDHNPFGAVSGGQAPATEPVYIERDAKDDPMKYEKPPIEDRVPDANNGPMIGEDYAAASERMDPRKPQTLFDPAGNPNPRETTDAYGNPIKTEALPSAPYDKQPPEGAAGADTPPATEPPATEPAPEPPATDLLP